MSIKKSDAKAKIEKSVLKIKIENKKKDFVSARRPTWLKSSSKLEDVVDLLLGQVGLVAAAHSGLKETRRQRENDFF
jgi:hypothetical protein